MTKTGMALFPLVLCYQEGDLLRYVWRIPRYSPGFMEGRVRNFFTYMKTRFILQILYRNATMYLHYLRYYR